MPVEALAVHGSGGRYRKHELKGAETNGPAVDAAKTGFVEQRDDVSWVDVAMAVKMREEP